MNENMKIKYFDEELEVYDERRVVNKNTYSITLNYVPSPTRPLTVENGKTMLTETNATPNANQYVLDRENGLLLFNQAMKGKVMTINYSAIGLWCISADKVYTNVDNKGKIVETLEDLMKENRQAIESIKTVGDASTVITQLQANIDSVTGLVGNIAEGSSVNEELTKSITSGKGTNTTLTNTISNANNKINEMNAWVNQHGDIVNLDNRVDTVETEIPKINEQLDKKTNKTETQNIQQQVNNLVLGAVGDGNNAEVVQARGEYAVLNERLDSEYKTINDKTENVKEILISNNLAKDEEINKNLDGTVTNGKNMQINGLGYCSIANGDTTYNILQYTLKGEKKLRVYCSYGSDTKYSVGFAFCDDTKKVISQYNNSVSGSGYIIIEVPKGATQIIVNGTNNLVPTIDENYNTLIPVIQYGYNYMKIFQRLAVIGDSLSSGELVYKDDGGTWQYVDKYGNSWLSYIAREIKAVRTHYSQGGITAKVWLDYYNHRLSSDTPYNAYFIALGTNDAYKKPYQLGTIGDVAGTDSFVGYYKQIIENVRLNAPNSVIFCCSRYSKNDSDGYNAMIKSITELYNGVFFVDIANESDITLDIGGEFVNGSHFTTLGYARLAGNIMRIVSNIILNNISYFKFFLLNNDSEKKYQA